MTKVAALMAAGLATVALVGCGANGDSGGSEKPAAPTSSSPSTFNVSGTVSLIDSDGYLADGNYALAGCEGTGGYDDIQTGAQVVVKDADGKQVALGKLGPGSMTAAPDDDPDASCEFPILVFGVPDDGELYSIKIGHRDDYSFSRSDAESGLALSLG